MKNSVHRVPYIPDGSPFIDKREVFKYLGYGKSPPDSVTADMVSKCSEQLSAAVVPRCVYAAFPIKAVNDGVALEGCSLTLKGKDISAHLKGCKIAVFMAVTLSEQTDRMIRRARAEDITLGLVMDSCANAAVEDVCDSVERVVKPKYQELYFTTRYSPGYGDFSVEVQSEFLRVLDAQRIIGLCATQTSILTPRKSVTAVIGVGNRPASEQKSKCDICHLKGNCPFLKRGEHCGLSKLA